MSELLQFTFGGLTVGFIYALVGLGFTVIYNSSKIINFSQGEFVMIGGMSAVFLSYAHFPFVLAFPIAIFFSSLLGYILFKLVSISKNSSTTSLIILTLGYSIFIRGAAQVVFDKQMHTLPPFISNTPITIYGATITPQAILVILVSLVIVLGLYVLFNKTKIGKAMLATADNKNAAKLVGISVRKILIWNFMISAGIASIGGIVLTPIISTNYEIGVMLGLKGFCAAIIGGIGNPFGAVFGGVLLGILESFVAGYLSSEYKDAVAFIVLLLILFFFPGGLFGSKKFARV
ncbi:branched-chain amino acid ABC transporter permease [Sulfurospirillum sp. 1612]|uniref:branched-chain amino acid ABC transporter permease n=1 Tax=Sulfurospirillum sp. 1612 TaxID=3094835 RepID=UPI002F92A7D1